MGAYFRCYRKDKSLIKTLIKKYKGSSYPNIFYFNNKINLLKKYLKNFVVDTKIDYDGKRIRIKQVLILGEDIFNFLKNNKGKKPKQFNQFVQGLNNLYKKTGTLPDLINKNNILITKDRKIKIVDVWPLFFRKRVIEKDLNEKSYKENLNQLKVLNNFK